MSGIIKARATCCSFLRLARTQHMQARSSAVNGSGDSSNTTSVKPHKFFDPTAGRQQSCVQERRVHRTPPGAESGACLQRGNSGTWENHLSPSITPGMGDRVTKAPGVTWRLHPGHEPDGTPRTL